MRANDTQRTVNRRNYLKGIGGVSAVGLAGCTGGGDDVYSLTFGCSSRGSTSFSCCQALQAAADQHSDILEITVTAPGGDPASIRSLDAGEADMFTSGTFIMTAAANERDPFDENPIETVGQLVMTYITIDMYTLQKADAGYSDFDDAIEQEAAIWGFPAGWGLRRLFQTILTEGGRWGDVEPLLEDMAAEDVAGALSEDRVEVFTGYGNSGVGLAGWEVEVDSRIEVEWLELPDWYWEAVDASPAFLNDIPPYGWEQDLGSPDTFPAWVDGFNMYAHPELEEEAVREVVRLGHEHTDTLRDAEPNFLDGSDLSNLTLGFWDREVHPGAASYYEDEGHSY